LVILATCSRRQGEPRRIPVTSVIQCSGDPAQGLAALAQLADFI
jgi:hypothetical protein